MTLSSATLRQVVRVVVVADHPLLVDPNNPGNVTDHPNHLLTDCQLFSVEKPDEDLQHPGRDWWKHDGNGSVACPQGCIVILC